MTNAINKIVWWIFGAMCVATGLYPFLYFCIDRHFGLLGQKSQVVLSDLIWNIGFYGHIVMGGIALLIGWTQFSKSLRKKRPSIHRAIGKVYVISVLISGICGIYIGFFATGGIVSRVGFISLGVIWLVTTTMAYQAIKTGDISAHQNYMIVSYACCFGAVTLRIWLPILITLLEGDFIPAYRIVAWLSWVPNILVAFYLIKRKKRVVAVEARLDLFTEPKKVMKRN